MLRTITIVTTGFLLLFIAIAGMARFIMVLCSAKARKSVRLRPVLHMVWLVATILTVVALFAPVIGTDHPVSKSVHTKTLERCLSTASESYFMTYARLPLQTNVSDHDYHNEHLELFSVLTGSSNSLTNNPRRIIFLDTSVDIRDGSGRFIDAWRRPLNILGDWNMDQQVLVGTNLVNTTMAIWSNGEDGRNDFGLGDDVCSWDK